MVHILKYQNPRPACLAARVHALEERMQRLQTAAPQQHMPADRRLVARDFGEGTIMARVDTLEQAVLALTRVQVGRRP